MHAIDVQALSIAALRPSARVWRARELESGKLDGLDLTISRERPNLCERGDGVPRNRSVWGLMTPVALRARRECMGRLKPQICFVARDGGFPCSRSPRLAWQS
jgi:hypothetical protein